MSTRALVGLVALTAILSAPACGGGDGSDDMRLVLTDEGCTYEGDEALATGAFTLDVENETEYYGAFALTSLAERSTIGDLEPYLERAHQQFQESGTLLEPPELYEQVVRSGVEAGSSGLLPGDVPAGSYALMCFVDDLPTWRVYAATQLEVTK